MPTTPGSASWMRSRVEKMCPCLGLNITVGPRRAPSGALLSTVEDLYFWDQALLLGASCR